MPSCGMLFKSWVELIDPTNVKLNGHDTIYLYRLLKSKYPSGKDLMTEIKLCRKYHTDTRYSNKTNTDVYNEEFGNRFIQIVADIKMFIDEDCIASLDDLMKKYK